MVVQLTLQNSVTRCIMYIGLNSVGVVGYTWKLCDRRKHSKHFFLQQIQELETEFEKIGNEKVVQTRFLRSQQELKAKIEAQADEDEEDGVYAERLFSNLLIYFLISDEPERYIDLNIV